VCTARASEGEKGTPTAITWRAGANAPIEIAFGRERTNGDAPKKDRPRLAELTGATRVSQSTPELSFDFEEEGEAAELDVVPSVN